MSWEANWETNWSVYACYPIDFGWQRLKTVKETAAELAIGGELLPGEADNLSEVSLFLADWDSAKRAAKRKGWDGDFRDGPCVFWLPGVGGFEYGFAFKQDNNGTTFVVSPQPLVGLEKFD